MKVLSQFVFTVAAIFPFVAIADPVSTNTMCVLAVIGGTTTSQTGPSSCNVTVAGQGTAAASITESGLDSTGLSFAASAEAQPISFTGVPLVTGSAKATESGGLLLYTPGPVQAGQMVFFESVHFDIPLDNAPLPYTFDLSVGTLHTSCGFGLPATCSGNFGPANGEMSGTEAVSFTLGQAFLLHGDLNIDAEGFSDSVVTENGFAEGAISAGFDFSMIDASGMPVPVYVCSPSVSVCISPEPSACGLIGIGLAGLLAFAGFNRAAGRRFLRPPNLNR